VTDTVPLGGCANCNCGQERSPAVNPNNHLVYVPGSGGMVHVFSGYDNSSVGTVYVDGNPTAAAVNPNTNLVYIANNTGTIPVVNSNTNTVVSEVRPPSCVPVVDIQVNPCTNQIYALRRDGSILIINGTCNCVENTFRPDCGASAIALDPSLGLLYAINSSHRAVSVFNACDFIGTLPLPVNGKTHLSSLAVNSATHLVYVTDSGNNVTFVADGGMRTLVETAPVGSAPHGAAVLACDGECPTGGGCCGNCGGSGCSGSCSNAAPIVQAAPAPFGIFTAGNAEQPLYTGGDAGGFVEFSNVLLDEGDIALQRDAAHIEVQQPGLYELTARVPLHSAAGAFRFRCALQINGAAVFEETLLGGGAQTGHGQFYARLAKGDSLSVPILEYSTQTPQGERIVNPYLALRLIGGRS
jgi:hypothetical protein